MSLEVSSVTNENSSKHYCHCRHESARLVPSKFKGSGGVNLSILAPCKVYLIEQCSMRNIHIRMIQRVSCKMRNVMTSQIKRET